MKLFHLLLLSAISPAQSEYISQIKVVDACTRLAEPVKIDAFGIKGTRLKTSDDISRAVEACQKSLTENSDDPHIKFLLARVYTENGKHEKGLKLAQESCRSGDTGGCTLLGIYYDKGFSIRRSSAKKYLLWQWSCSQGDPLGCFNLGVTSGRKDPYSPQKFKHMESYFFDVCVSGMYDRACIGYANNMYFKNVPYDQERFEYASYKACTLGDEIACYDLEKTLKQKKDPRKKEKLHYALQISCKQENAKACERIGSMHMQEATKSAQTSLYDRNEKACIGNIPKRYACFSAGENYIYINRDIARGIKFWEKSCHDREYGTACYFLAKIYLDEKNLTYHDKEKALRTLQKGCALNEKNSLYLGCEQGVEMCCEKMKAQ